MTSGRGDLASVVRRRRLELRLTQRQAAERAGVSLATWQTLERRSAEQPSFQELTLSRVAHGLELRLGDLQALNPADPAAAQGPGGAPDGPRELGRGPAGDDSPQALVASLAEQLIELSRISEESFRVVHGQAADAAEHFLRVLQR